ncbi:MAG: hypothetical protein K1Y36_03970 [Blastocatellia bacterium]|nr:hypothetical protein [Blastocatellia bacterium]
MKKFAGVFLALGLVLTSGILLGSPAQAQDWRRDNWRRDRYRNNRYPSQQNNRNCEPNNRGYGNYGYSNQREYEHGYRDGLNRGREDAQTHRTPTPNNSSHFRDGNPSYRDGFSRGYYEAYRSYASYRRY